MIIYSSSGFADKNVYQFCVSHLARRNLSIKACIITTAAVPLKENNKWSIFTKEFFAKEGIFNIFFFDFENDPLESLHDYTLIIILGGNPYHLFHHVKKTKAENTLRSIADSNRIIIGISAGAMLLSSGIHYIEEWNRIMGFDSSKDNNIGLTDFSGIRYTDAILFPHYDFFLSKQPKLEAELLKIEYRDGIFIKRYNNDQSLYHKNNEFILIE